MERQTPAPPDILELLDGAQFPATKLELIDYAYDNDAGEEAIEMLRALPEDTYNHMSDVRKNLGSIASLPGVQQWSAEDTEDSDDPDSDSDRDVA